MRSRQIAYSDALPLDQALQCQQELILARFYAGFRGSLFAQTQETANLVAEFGQSLILIRGKVGFKGIQGLQSLS